MFAIFSRLLLFLAGCSVLVSCTYSRAILDYQEFSEKIKVYQEDPEGQYLGEVKADEKGVIYDGCLLLARKSFYIIIDSVRALGGNAVSNFRWIPDDDGGFVNPHCKQRWGFVLFWPLLFTNYFMSATIQAKAFLVKEETKLP